MAPTARTTPVGTALEDGFSTKVAFAADPDVSFWEKTVTPPGIDGGDGIEQTTMFNTTWRTFAARSLRTLTDVSLTAAYDPAVYPQIVSLINVEGLITVHFPDGSTLDFYGFLKEFTPGENSEGDQPEADITIICTNRNPVSGAEVGPIFTD